MTLIHSHWIFIGWLRKRLKKRTKWLQYVQFASIWLSKPWLIAKSTEEIGNIMLHLESLARAADQNLEKTNVPILQTHHSTRGRDRMGTGTPCVSKSVVSSSASENTVPYVCCFASDQECFQFIIGPRYHLIPISQEAH